MSLNKIVVVKYVNPYLFWIRESEDLTNLELIERCLNNDLKKTTPPLACNANELVALQDSGGFKRAIVADVNNGYKCWLLDYGQYVFTCDVYKLSKQLCAMVPTIKVACLDNVVGVRHRLNIDTCQDETEISPYFHAHAVQYVENKLSQASDIYFCTQRKINDVLCGSFILEIGGAKFNLAELLVQEGLATINKEFFPEALSVNCPDNPITTLYTDSMSDDDNICCVEGVGRGTHRTKVMSEKDQQVNKWLGKVNEVLPISTTEDKAKEDSILLNTCDLLQDSSSDSSQMLVSNNSTSMNTSFSDSSKGSVKISSGKKLRGRGKLLSNESNNSVNNEVVQFAKQGTLNNENVKDVKTSESSDILKLIPNADVKKQSEYVQEKVRAGTSSVKPKKQMKKSEILKMLSGSESNTEEVELKSTTDFCETSSNDSRFIATNNNLKKTNFSSSSDPESSVSNQPAKAAECEKTLKGVIMTNTLSCKCEYCKKVFDDDFDETPKVFTDEIKVVEPVYRGKPQPLIKTHSLKSDTLIIRKRDKHQTKIEKDMAPNVLIHSLGHMPAPTSDISNVPFCIPVHNALRTMKYKIPRAVQMYMWPALMRSMNACIVNGQSTGKTMCYLPVLCSFLIQKEGRYPFLPKVPSPIAVILCNSIKKAEEIFDLLRTFLTHTCKKVDIALVVPPVEETIKVLKRAEIIVSTPKLFVRILSSHCINLKRLCQLIIEDTDIILDQTSEEFYKIINATQSMLDHRIFVNSVQIIMTSEKWTIALEDFVRKLEVTPVICIGSHLESAIYAKANIKMHFVKEDEKMKHVMNMLKENSKDLKTVIVCNTDNEVVSMADYFQILGISVISVSKSMVREEIEEKEVLWLSTPLRNNSVFICTDYMLHTQLSITTAQVLILYSLPSDSWSLFARRFKCIIDSHDSPFNPKFNRANAVKVHIFVDESCSKQFPRLYYFLQQTKTVLPEHFKSFCEKVEKAEESMKIENKKPICKRLKLLGKCTKFRCKKRHLFSQDLDIGDDVPRSGIIKFKLLHVADVAQYGIKVLEHWDTNREKRNLNDYTSLVTKELRDSVINNKLMVIDVKVGSLYVYFDAKEVTYHRCKVLKILSFQHITNVAHEIKIKLIDDGIVKKAFTSLLFELSPEFFEIPPQSIEVRLANIVPLEHDTDWNLRTKCKVENMMKDLIQKYPNAYFVGRIVLQIGGTVWLEDMMMREDITSSKEIVTLLTLKKKLCSLDLVDFNESPLNGLRNICLKSDLDLPNYDVKPVPRPTIKKTTQINPLWAYLDTQPNVYNVVYFSHAESPQKFYVKLEKYYDLYVDLEEEIKIALEKPFYPTIDEVVVENCYLAKDCGSDAYNRVIVKKIEEQIATCFCVDFGDTIDISLDDLKYLSNEHISKLPFQAIECELYGIKPIMETWPPEATNVFYKFCYVTGSDIYRDLFVNVIDSKQADYGRTKYSVAMLDYFEDKETLINKILIDCGLAIDDETEKLEDLLLPEFILDDEEQESVVTAVCNPDNDDDELRFETTLSMNLLSDIFKEMDKQLADKGHSLQNMDEILEDIDADVYENAGWNFSCFNRKTFMNDLLKKRLPPLESKPPSSNDSSNNYFVPMKAVPSTSYYTPNVTWYQTKTHVIMEIQLQNVQDYSAIILRKKTFLFSTKLNDKEYTLNFPLFNNISHVEKINTGLVIKVTLTKSKEEEWPKLVNSKEKMRNIKYDFAKIGEEEPKKRRFLDHGFGPDDDDEDYPTYHNLSSEESDSNSEEYDDAQ